MVVDIYGKQALVVEIQTGDHDGSVDKSSGCFEAAIDTRQVYILCTIQDIRTPTSDTW